MYATVAGVLLGFTVPVLAFFAAGVSVADAGGLGAALGQAVTVGVIAGLVLGKTVGILGATYLVQRFTRVRLADGLSWWDVLGLSLLDGIGFTVSLLIGELAFGTGTSQDDNLKLGSVLAALLATLVLRIRNRHYRRLCAYEERDIDADGIPDVPTGRTGTVDDVANLIEFLCRNESGYITGATYDVNGGSHIQ